MLCCGVFYYRVLSLSFFFLMNLENGLAKGFIFFFLIMLINTEFKGNDFVPSSIFFLCL
jgi:hypothetical protein